MNFTQFSLWFYSNHAAKLLNSFDTTKQTPQFLNSNVRFCGKRKRISGTSRLIQCIIWPVPKIQGFALSNPLIRCIVPPPSKALYIVNNSSMSFIKVFCIRTTQWQMQVQSYTFPTTLLYTFILHQTTTFYVNSRKKNDCFIPLFYIKPQHRAAQYFLTAHCFIPLFYIKPQLICSFLRELDYCFIPLFYIKPQPLTISFWRL